MKRGNYLEQLRTALSAHQARQFREAERIYRALLRVNPEDPRVLGMLGVLSSQLGRPEEADRLLEHATSIDPHNVELLHNRSAVLEKLGRTREAVELFEKAIRISGINDKSRIRLAGLLIAAAEYSRAEKQLKEVLRKDPTNIELLNLVGRCQRAQGRNDDAIQTYRKALQIRPEAPLTLYNLGIALHFERQLREAAACFSRASELEPQNADILNNLGMTLRELDRLDEAEAALVHAMRMSPEHRGVLMNLGNTLRDLNRAHDALAIFQQALAAGAEDADVHVALGTAYGDLGLFDQEDQEYRIALELEPANADALFNRGVRSLQCGRYKEGWNDYEWRWLRKASARLERTFEIPRWDGQSLAGSRVLITAEQGIGDEIMFASIVPEILREVAYCVLECSSKLEGLFRRSFPGAVVFATAQGAADWVTASVAELTRLGPYDCMVPAGSLPRFFRPNLGAFPPHRGYLAADSERTNRWRRRLDALGSGLKVGISWRGGTARTGMARRSIPLARLTPLLRHRDAHFISLQYTDCEAEIATLAKEHGVQVHHWPEAIRDYEETSALVAGLDLTITVCTAIVHLCGALGRPAWVLTPLNPEWRYGLNGRSMPWYPSITILRQQNEGEWGALIDHVAQQLELYGRQEEQA